MRDRPTDATTLEDRRAIRKPSPSVGNPAQWQVEPSAELPLPELPAWVTQPPEAKGPGGADAADLSKQTRSLGNPIPSEEACLFDKYTVDWRLGGGGMATVWRVRHKELNSCRALKLIRPKIEFDKKARDDFRREARFMAELSHPNAVIVHDARVDEHVAYIEMELIQGESLEKILEPGKPMPVDWVARVLIQLCDLLQFIHAKGIVHRDLKPSNLMLISGRRVGDESLKVLDFGIAKSLGQKTDNPEALEAPTGGSGYTPHYCSPEQAGGANDVDARSDIYTTGVILYEFLTGHRPFDGRSLIHQHLCSPAPAFESKNPWNDVPPNVEAVVLQCLEKDPARRPQTANELCSAFLGAIVASGLALPVASHSTSSGVFSPAPSGFSAEAVESSFLEIDGDTDHAATTWLLGIAGGLIVSVILGVLGWLVFRVSPSSEAGASISAATSREAQVHQRTSSAPVILYPLPPNYEEVAEGREGPYPKVIQRIGTRYRFRFQPGGSFQRGADPTHSAFTDRMTGEDDARDDLPQHEVRVSSFYIQEAEVTNGEIAAFLLGRESRESPYNRNADLLRDKPAVFVSKAVAHAYAQSVGGELPSELQWEYTARSGEMIYQPYVWSRKDKAPGHVRDDLNIAIKQIPALPINAITRSAESDNDRTPRGVTGLMGNVREWCLDEWAPYSLVSPLKDDLDPVNFVPSSKPQSVIRGGSFRSLAERCQTTWPRRLVARYDRETLDQLERDGRADDIGFRVVLKVPEPQVQGEVPVGAVSD